MNKRNEELLDDTISFHRLVGGADSLCESGRDPDEIMDEFYMEEIEDLALKWVLDECCIKSIDECLEVEKLLREFFKKEILEIMNK